MSNNIIQLRPAPVLRDTVDETDVRRELVAYCEGMIVTLKQRPTNGELEMLINLSSNVNTLLRAMQSARTIAHLNALKAKLEEFTK